MTTARRATGARNESLQSTTQRVYDDAGRDTKAAKAALLIEIRKRPALHEEAFAIAVDALIAACRHRDNGRVKSGLDIGTVTVTLAANDEPVKYTPQSAASIAASKARLERFATKLTGLYLYKLMDGAGNDFMLGNATPEMLRPAIYHYQTQGASMVRTARWLEKIAASAEEGVAIHKSVKLADIERFQREANESPV